MSHRRQQVWSRRVFVALLALSGVAVEAGEPIRFSKPAVPIATPFKGEELPDHPSRDIKFGGTRELQQPIMAPPQVLILRGKRDRADDDDNAEGKQPRLPGEAREAYEDRVKRELARTFHPNNAFTPERNPALSPNDLFNRTQPGALAPVMDFNWNSDNAQAPGKGLSSSLNSSEKGGGFWSGRNELFSFGKDQGSFADLFTPPVRDDKFLRAQSERRAAFEQILRPTPVLAARAPGSLEPVLPYDPLHRQSPATSPNLPTMGGGKVPDVNPLHALTDPTVAFQRQQERQLRGPAFEDPTRAFNNPAPTPAASPLGQNLPPAFATPLNRQPTVHDFPKRRF